MKSIWLKVAAGVLVIVGSGLAYLHFTGTPPARLVEFLAEGGEKILREPMRPASGGTRVLVFALDGVGDEEMRRALADGGAPNIAALVGAGQGEFGLYANGYAVPGVLSILPSTTYAAWSSLFTGEPASRTGVPGNEWFVREEMKFYAPAPVSVTENAHALEVYTNDLVGGALRVPTLFERADVRSYVSLSHIYRGADLITTPSPKVLGDLVTAAAAGLADAGEISDEMYAKLDRASVESLVESIRKHGVADLQVVYLPGVDLYTHATEYPLDDQRDYLRDVIDPAVGAVLRAYREQGALDGTYVLFVSDHGHTPVLDDAQHALGTEGVGNPPELIRRVGFRMRPFTLNPGEDEQDYQATVAYQGAMAYVYLADRSTCPEPGSRCDWRKAPRLAEDVLPVARAFFEANRSGAMIPELRGTLDLIFAREPRAPGEDALPFQIWDGRRLVPIGEYLAANPRPELLELESRMEGLAAGPYGHRAGDVLLLSRSGGERQIEERYYFSDRYRSWHGSPSGQDSRIPLVVARSGSSGAELRDRVRLAVGDNPSQLDITPLILHLLTVR
jgi:hypothetical protein